ncbi:helix-turn-helix domain-containing protein [Bifidobacterium olomucense]|uniref:HTH cro/C1-type domain-containing protein n=1 Tax=Bifidobacterium olomucense TaxID=2675324 RepID=A0A7Y0F147_9BIFI|nr:helix-turn-helix transcriptional regulator [Bifidobacterium sp. DSM 109959]NMM99116.1 hypothetical protein [Bifidobacterium sp. DSM 109959]
MAGIEIALPKNMERYRSRIRNLYAEQDSGTSYWIDFAPGWRSWDSTPTAPCHCAHWDSKAEIWDELRNALPCECPGCKAAGNRRGRALAALRASVGISQAQLGAKAHVPAGRIGDWEQGFRTLDGVKLSTAKRLADALGVSLDELWERCAA